MGDRSLTLNLAEETFAGLDRLSRETGRSPNQLVQEALTRYIDYESWKLEKIRNAMRRADAGEFATDEEMGSAFDRYRHAAARSE
jgi:RHH-type rel operon transcriptional repressor/antitoxin RelB